MLGGMEELSGDVGKQTPVGSVQVDAFCAQCSYNLFSQVVLRDERLGILVCRCPECGRFSSAAALSTANQKLADRLATGAWIVYLALFLGLVGIAVGGLLGTQGTYLDDSFSKLTPSNPPMDISTWPELLGAAIAGSLLGGFFAVFCWHWRRGWRYLAGLLPCLLAPLTWYFWHSSGIPSEAKHYICWWAIKVLGVVVGLQTMCIIAGEAIGRPFARLALNILLPSRPRRYLGFLWFVDGKRPPTLSEAPGSNVGK